MILFTMIDTTDDSPISSVIRFADRDGLAKYFGFDPDGRFVGDEDDCPYGFDEDEWKQLTTSGSLYRDKREVYAIIDTNDAVDGEK